MNKLIFSIFSLLLIVHANAQKIHYSDNRLYSSPEHLYNIIGKVNNKIFVWQTNAKKHFASDIIIYNDELQLMHAASTNILESSVDPQPYFFITGNTFKVIYKYRDRDYLYYRVAGFDEYGTLLSVQALDSSTIKKDSLQEAGYAYSMLQSVDTKNICFLKIGYDENNHALLLNRSYIDDTIIHKDFAFSIDVTKEMLAGISIDNDKNLLLVFEKNTESVTNLTVVRKNYSDNLMFVINKTVKAGGFKDQSVHIAQNPAGYIIYGELNGSNNLFIWQTDNKLNDLAGDTILNKPFKGRLSFIPSGNNMTNAFVTWSRSKNYTSNKGERLNSEPQKISIPNYSNDPAYIVRYNNLTPDEIATRKNYMEKLSSESVFRDKNGYASTLPYSKTQEAAEAPLKNMALFRTDSSNSIAWSKDFTNISEDKTSTNLDNSSIIARNKNLHVIYEARIKNKPRLLNHFIIGADGAVTETHFTSWDKKYQYLLNKSVLIDGNTLIVPSIKGSYMKFAKIKIE